MNGNILRIPLGIATLLLAVFILLVSQGLLPTAAAADERGTYIPLLFTWGMVLLIEGCALALAWFLFTGGKGARR
jgi:hypothetical protein